MFSYLLRRMLWVLPVIVVVSAVTFFLMYRAPGGPWDREKPLPAATVRNLNKKFGLDKPLWINTEAFRKKRAEGEGNPFTLIRAGTDSQFLNYMVGVLHFDLGPSYQSRGTQSVQSIIVDRFPVSAKVGLVAILFATSLGIPLGIISSLRQNTWIDYGSLLVSTLGISVPTFVSGILLLILLSQQFGVSPIHRPEEWNAIGRAYLLPGIVLGLGTMSYITRLTRVAMLEVKRQDYVRTARAKGMRERSVVGRHMLRNALIPVITILGPASADLITGSIIIETIFNVPGMGREFVNSISKRDYSMIMGTTIFYAFLIAVANVTVDIAYGVLDPRIRVSR
jgi:oligopeptide transport system permease protein